MYNQAWFGSGYEFMGNFMGEIGFDKKYLIAAYILSIIGSIGILMVPIIASATVPYDDCTDWYAGYFAVAYGEILGRGMYWSINVGALTCMWGLYCIAVALSGRVYWAISQPYITILNDGRLIIEGDEDEPAMTHTQLIKESDIDRKIPIAVLPHRWLGVLWERNRSPVRGVIFQTITVAINCLWLNADIVAEVCVYFYFITFVNIVVGYMVIKYNEPNIEREFEVPFGKIGAWICAGFLMLFMGVIIGTILVNSATFAWVGIAIGVNILFVGWYVIRHWIRQNNEDKLYDDEEEELLKGDEFEASMGAVEIEDNQENEWRSLV